MMCGSLSMSLQSGLWMRHSTGDKGDIFHFVSLATNKSKRKALKQLAEDLGFKSRGNKLVRSREEVKATAVNVEVRSKTESELLTAQWVAMKTVPDNVLPFKAEKHFAYLLSSNNLIASYEYRNKSNQIIGYALRLEDKVSGKKQVLPVSYCYNQDLDKNTWRLKGFTDDVGHKPIYGAEKLVVDNNLVLIVEGEKTAEKAQALLLEYNVISWLGGSKAAVNVNWQALENKDVVIWPDNDSPGFAAARVIQQKLITLANSCMVVDPRILNLPEKWDLGDANNQDVRIIRSALVNSYHPGSIKIIDQCTGALDHQNLNNDQLISLLEKEVVSRLRLDGKASEQYLTRMQEELKVISSTGFGADFAIAANIARYCRRQLSIPIGLGRGSSVSSLVAYGLNIHQIDPVENNLLFERFLTSNSVSNPDFDFDIAASKKILVENYLLAKYANSSKLSVISNKEEKIRTIHPSGIGIVPERLQEQLPYSKISSNFWADRALLEIDHKQAESLGVKKFDLLSSQVIEGVDKVERLIEGGMSEVTDNKCKVIDWYEIGWHDAKSFALIKAGHTEGIYQLGSNFAKEVALQVKLEKFEDLVNLLALIRPGTKNYIKYFADNNDAKARFSGFSDPKNIFKDTKGVILFQEQVMQAAEHYLGMDKSETNQFRKELEKASSNHPMYDQERFFTYATARGLRQQDATCLYELMKEFSKFGYNKSHAIAYARVTFKTAYLKAHYPEEFQEIFKSNRQQIIQKEVVINNAKDPEKLKQSKTDDQATYTEEQIIIPKADAKIGFIEVSGGTYPHRNITILADNLDKALAIKQAGISARILCMQDIDNIKNYQAQEKERVLLVVNNDGELSSSFKAITRAIEDLEAKGVIVSYLCPDTKGDFNDVLQNKGIAGVNEIIETTLMKLANSNGYENQIAQLIKKYQQQQPELLDRFTSAIQKIEKYRSEEIANIVKSCRAKGINYGAHQAISIAEEIDKDVDITFKVYKDRIDDIKKLAPNYDFQDLRERMKIAGVKGSVSVLESELVQVFKDHVLPQIEEITKEKMEAKSVGEVIKVLAKEQEFCVNVRDHYWEASYALRKRENFDYFASTYATYQNHPNLIDNLKVEVDTANKFGLSMDKHSLEMINSHSAAKIGE